MHTPVDPENLWDRLASRGWDGKCTLMGQSSSDLPLLAWVVHHASEIWSEAVAVWRLSEVPALLAEATQAALMCACQKKGGVVLTSEDLVRLLDVHGALGMDINAPLVGFEGGTCLAVACRRRQDLVEVLLQHGASPRIRPGQDPSASPLSNALLWHIPPAAALQAVALLLKYGADPNETRADDGESVLSYALYQGHVGCVPALLAAGADPNGPVREGHASILTLAAVLAPQVLGDLLAAGAHEAPLAEAMETSNSDVQEESRAFWAARTLRKSLGQLGGEDEGAPFRPRL